MTSGRADSDDDDGDWGDNEDDDDDDDDVPSDGENGVGGGVAEKGDSILGPDGVGRYVRSTVQDYFMIQTELLRVSDCVFFAHRRYLFRDFSVAPGPAKDQLHV